MARLSKTVANPGRSRSALATAPAAKPNARTHEGALAFTKDSKTDLFLTATTGFYGEAKFYESAEARDGRLVQLARAVAVADPKWFGQFVRWLRGSANIRTAAIVIAAHGADAQLKAKVGPGVRSLVSSVLQRADEPGEFITAWRGLVGRNSLPGGVQRGLEDAVLRLYTEYAVGKYDTAGREGYRFGDVVALVRPEAVKGSLQDYLIKHLLDRRRHPDEPIPEALAMLNARKALLARLGTERDAVLALPNVSDVFREAGLTWENLGGTGKMDAKAWEAMIPGMGFMALLRNLRNFDEQGVSRGSKEKVSRRLTDPVQVAKSRQLPYRFLSAYLEANGSIWQTALDVALQHSLPNIPELPGKTVVLVDTSGSMTSLPYSAKSKITPIMAGALFGVALAAKNRGAVLYGFANGTNVFQHAVNQDDAVLRRTFEFINRSGEDGHGTEIEASLRKAVQRNPDAARFVIVSDMQCFGGYGRVGSGAPATTPVYAFDCSGYAATPMESGSYRHQLGGLTDATFGMISTIEAGQQAKWPWEQVG